MKKLIITAFTFIFTFTACFSINYIFNKTKSVNSLNGNDKTNLVIDAGHGGIDAGTIGADGTLEKYINLDIALKLYDFASVSGLSAYLTRDGDYLVYREGEDKSRSDLYNRMDYINSVKNSVLISIHQNFFQNNSENGMQIWYSPNDNSSKILADNILEITKQNLQQDNKRVNKESDSSYYLLYKAKSPSVMVECGFMSNPEENEKLKDNKYQNDLAYSIMLGYCEYITGVSNGKK